MHFRMSGITGSQILTARAAFGDAADKVKDPSLHLKYGYVQDDASENLMELSFKLRFFQTSCACACAITAPSSRYPSPSA